MMPMAVLPRSTTLVLLLPMATALRAQPTVTAPGLHPPHARVIDLTPTPGGFSEPSIAVNQRNPHQVVAAYQDNAHVAYSADSGHTWHTAAGTAPPDYRVSGDVSITFDRHGHAMLCYIAFDALGTRDYWAHGATRNGIFVRRSLDGGRTWEPNDVAVVAYPTRPGIPFEDKPYIVADDTDGPFAGNLYVGWTEFTLDSTVILFSRSTDDGQTWSAPARISTHAGLPRDDNGAVEGFTGAVAPDGTLYVAWSDGNDIAFTTSRNGGQSFDPSRFVVHTAASYFTPTHVYRANGFPQLALDPRGGGRGGRLYLAWSDFRNGDVDVFTAASSDGGRTWTPAVRVNDDPVHDGADQFFQWLAVDPATGAVNVIFYDRRGDPTNRSPVVVLARSTDGGRTFVNYAWTDVPFDPEGAFLGDYTGIASFDQRVYGIWTEQAPAPSGAGSARGRQLPHTTVRVGIADFHTSP
jgi:hypothetical protein